MSQFESINTFNVYFSNQLRNFKLNEYYKQKDLIYYTISQFTPTFLKVLQKCSKLRNIIII